MKKSEIAQYFSNGNFEICLEYICENAVWNTPGEQILNGKDEIVDFCKKIKSYFESVTTNFKQLNLIENKNCIAINGTAQFISNGKIINLIASCDIYEFNDQNKIVYITSYCISDRK